jgi:hypothetical protein
LRVRPPVSAELDRANVHKFSILPEGRLDAPNRTTAAILLRAVHPQRRYVSATAQQAISHRESQARIARNWVHEGGKMIAPVAHVMPAQNEHQPLCMRPELCCLRARLASFGRNIFGKDCCEIKYTTLMHMPRPLAILSRNRNSNESWLLNTAEILRVYQVHADREARPTASIIVSLFCPEVSK